MTNRSMQASEPDFPLGIAKPALRALANAGYRNLEQLAKVRESDLLKLHGMGPNALERIRRALEEKGMTFAE